MREHPRMLTDCGVSKHRYDELQAISRQYQDYRKGYGGERGAWRAKAIKAAAKTAGREDWRTILQSVTEGLPLDGLSKQPTCSPMEWYRLRLGFYIVLHHALIEYENSRGRGMHIDVEDENEDTALC